MNGRIKIILNPASDQGGAQKLIMKIDQIMKNLGLNFELTQTQRPWHAAEIAQKAVQDGYHIVVAAGGDGTANEVLNGLMNEKKRTGKTSILGLLPIGRGNDFAFGLNIPQELHSACSLLAQSELHSIDIGYVQGGLYPDGRFFGNGVGIGFDAVVGFEAQKMTHLHGFLSYMVAALKTIFLFDHGPQMMIEYDNEKILQPTLMVSIMNGRRMGGGFMMAPTGQMNDGFLNLCIAKQVSRLKIFSLITRFMQGTQETHPAIFTAKSKKITVRALQSSLPAHADGETLCTDGNMLSVEVYPAQIEVICNLEP